MKRTGTLALAALAMTGLTMTGLAAAAESAARSVTAANPDSIAAVLRDKGYQAEMTKDSTGDPMIRSAASGSRFTILFMGCTKNQACTTIQLYAGYKASKKIALDRVNEWNRTRRFARAYIDSDGDPVVEMDIDLDMGGVSPALFADQLEVWTTVLGEYRTFVGA